MASDVVNKIRSRCYWEAIIRPDQFDSAKIDDYDLLFPIVEESVVTLNRWPFPVFDGGQEARRSGNDWVGEEIDWQIGPSLWRLYQSGQFVSLLAMWRDWTGRDPKNPQGDGPQQYLPLWDTIRQFTEIYEFAARLALTEAGDAAMRVHVKIGNIGGRILGQDDLRKTPLRHHTFKARDFVYPGPRSAPISQEILVADPRELAAEGLVDLFKQFEFNVGTKAIRSWQDEIDTP